MCFAKNYYNSLEMEFVRALTSRQLETIASSITLVHIATFLVVILV